MPEKKITYQIRLKFDLYNCFMDLVDFPTQGSNLLGRKEKDKKNKRTE